MADLKLITSDKLKGLEVDDNDHPRAAPSFSTGQMRLAFKDGDPTLVLEWMLEFDSPTSGTKFWRYDARFHDVMREVLKDNGIDAS